MTTKAERIGAEITSAVRSYVARALAERDRRLDALEAQQSKSLADLYRGSYQPNGHYDRGCLVNDHSSLWLCMRATSARPGDSADWRLVLKR